MEFFFKILLKKIAHRAKARVVNQHLDFKPALFCFAKQFRGGVLFRQIQCYVLCVDSTCAPQLVAQRCEFAFSSRDEQDVLALRCELAGECFADAAGCTCDERGVHELLAFKFRIWSLLNNAQW